MSDGLMPYMGAIEPLARDSRRAGRQISRMEGRTQVRLAGVDKETDVTLAKVASLTSVVAHAMNEVTRISQLQTQLETVAPAASGRLAMLADYHATSLMQVAGDHAYTLRRR